MGVILDIAPKVTVNGGANVDLTEVHQKIEANKQAIGELSTLETESKDSLVEAINEIKNDLGGKVDTARIEAIERYILSLEERLSKIDIEILDPASILFLD